MSSQNSIDDLEAILPQASSSVFHEARHAALHAGLSVMVSRNGSLYLEGPDGRSLRVKSIPAPIPVRPGTKYLLP